jgi:hypothetical protein
MRAMQLTDAPAGNDKVISHCSHLSRMETRPVYPAKMRECLAAYIDIHGTCAWTLFDLGSDCNAISPSFAQIAGVPAVKLKNPVALELGCKGSKSRITHGTTVQTTLGTTSKDWYFDIANIAHYDAIVGMPFCTQFGLMIDIKGRAITLADGSQLKISLEGGRAGGSDKFAKTKPKAMPAPPG